ncbi:hypothetical protein [Chryseobacterium sp.]|uniref:hypothetical protein n=1 Tax=Chryseobacterium sp. TaxID=1871047 RepID=UPI0025BFACA3|nr:hypothetical protein [Chryseobacterium sp.]
MAIENSKGDSLQDTLLSITFPTVLYPKMEEDVFWEHEDDDEPIYGIEDFIQENKDLATTDQQTLFNKIEEKYFQITEEGYGQMFWIAEPFTPFKEGSTDFEDMEFYLYG